MNSSTQTQVDQFLRHHPMKKTPIHLSISYAHDQGSTSFMLNYVRSNNWAKKITIENHNFLESLAWLKCSH
jgi:hypothetical protein